MHIRAYMCIYGIYIYTQYIYIYTEHIQGVQDKFDSFIREDKKLLGNYNM